MFSSYYRVQRLFGAVLAITLIAGPHGEALGDAGDSTTFFTSDGSTTEAGDGGFGEVDNECHYTGFRGGPFPGLPACTEGFTTEPLTCTNCTQSWDPESDERIVCADESDCVELVGKYMACGGPISPFLVDDSDNIYFWAGRWNLHSLDKRGNLRWRFDLCNPPQDTLCAHDTEECLSHVSRMVSMVMDYYGTLYFFIGNVLHAINSGGDVILKHEVNVPGVTLEERQFLSISTGPAEYSGSGWLDLRGSPILHEDGTLTVTYGVLSPDGADGVLPSGILRISRTGRVLESGDFFWAGHDPVLTVSVRLVGAKNGQIGFASKWQHYPVQPNEPFGMFSAFEDFAPAWHTEIPVDFWAPTHREDDGIRPDLAVDTRGRVYGLSRLGAVYGFDVEAKKKTRLFNFHVADVFSWQNRPVIDGNGVMYFTYHQRPLGPGYLWALDTKHLWENPVSERSSPWQVPEPEDYEGVKWRRIYGGGGAWTTPALSKNGRLYAGMPGLAAHDTETGEQIWWFGSRTMGSSPTILSDGTIVVGQGITGRIFFLREDTPNGGMLEAGWPTVRHDRYLSNNTEHPFRWDRSGEPPYPPVEELLAESAECWTDGRWNVEECGVVDQRDEENPDTTVPSVQLPDAADTDDALPDAGAVDTADDTSPADAHSFDHDARSEPSRAVAGQNGGCAGCSASPNADGADPWWALVLLPLLLAARVLWGPR